MEIHSNKKYGNNVEGAFLLILLELVKYHERSVGIGRGHNDALNVTQSRQPTNYAIQPLQIVTQSRQPTNYAIQPLQIVTQVN